MNKNKKIFVGIPQTKIIHRPWPSTSEYKHQRLKKTPQNSKQKNYKEKKVTFPSDDKRENILE